MKKIRWLVASRERQIDVLSNVWRAQNTQAIDDLHLWSDEEMEQQLHISTNQDRSDVLVFIPIFFSLLIFDCIASSHFSLYFPWEI